MKLNIKSLENKAQWDKIGVKLPDFDINKVKANTYENPIWVHFGAGNIFRAFPALAQQKLIEKGLSDKGIIAAFAIEPEVITDLWEPCDNLSLIVTLKTDATTEKKIAASVTEALYADKSSPDWERMTEIFKKPSLQMVSLTITEKGYADLSENSVMAKLTMLCYERFLAGAYPVSLVSMDNCSENGTKLQAAILASANKLSLEKGFIDYISSPEKVGFPWSMIDKITPRPDDKVKSDLLALGFEDAETIITEKGTYASAFVNAEECEYLIIEDIFPNGRPPLEEAGLIFTDRETVTKSEKMKVCTCLNPLHTALAIFGCLLSHKSIADEMKDNDLNTFVHKLALEEGMPVVVNPVILDPVNFLNEVLEVRFPNPFLPDTPQRIATDTSQKLPIRFGETLKAYLTREDLDIKSLKYIPFVFAGWCRYLMGINDNEDVFELSPDPLFTELLPFTSPDSILGREDIFGVDLYKIGLAEKVKECYNKMQGRNAVRSALKEIIS